MTISAQEPAVKVPRLGLLIILAGFTVNISISLGHAI